MNPRFFEMTQKTYAQVLIVYVFENKMHAKCYKTIVNESGTLKISNEVNEIEMQCNYGYNKGLYIASFFIIL